MWRSLFINLCIDKVGDIGQSRTANQWNDVGPIGSLYEYINCGGKMPLEIIKIVDMYKI